MSFATLTKLGISCGSVACLLVYAGVAIANGFDRISAKEVVVERLVPVPFRAAADRAAAQIAFINGQLDDALMASRKAINSDPISPDSTAIYATVLSQSGRDDEADAAFRVAAQFGWRNEQTQAYWYGTALSVNDLRLAADRADALLRAHPLLAESEELLAPMEQSREGRTALAEKLATQPPWMKVYFALDSKANAETIDRRMLVAKLLPASSAGETCRAMLPLTQALLGSGRHQDAVAIWNRHCPANVLTGPVEDPDFSQVGSASGDASPFAWRSIADGDLRFTRDTGDDAVLAIKNSSTVTKLALLQVVALQPGRYRIAVSMAQDARPGKVWLTVGCGGLPPFPRGLADAAQLGGTEIDVAPCSQQQLGLWIEPQSVAQLRELSIKRIGVGAVR